MNASQVLMVSSLLAATVAAAEPDRDPAEEQRERAETRRVEAEESARVETRLLRLDPSLERDALGRRLFRLVEGADLIVVAAVEEIQEAGDWLREEGLADDAEPYREAIALVDEVWKGEWTTRVTFRASPLGPGDESHAVADERVVLFLRGNGESAYALASAGEGRVPIVFKAGEEALILYSDSPSEPSLTPSLAVCRERVRQLVSALED